MLIWLVREAENYPFEETRPQRMGLLAQEYLKLGHDVVWWHSTFNHFKKTFVYNKDTDIDINEHFKVKLLHTSGYKKNVSAKRIIHHKRIAKKFLKLANKEVKKPDLIVVSMPHISFAKAAVKYGTKNNIPVYIDVRDLNPDVFVSPFSGLKKQIVKVLIKPAKRMLSYSIKNATGIIATTQPYLDWALHKYGKRNEGPNDRVFFVSYPFKEPIKQISNESKWSKYLDPNCLNVCFFGQFASLADINTVIDAALICQGSNINVKFLMCGEGELLEKYKEKVSSLNLKNIIFPGWVNSTDIQEIGFVSDCALLPYRTAPNFELQITNKYSEYLALGLAVLVQPNGIMRDTTIKNRCGLAYSDSNELCECFKTLLNDKKLLETFKINARRLFEEQFCAEKVYKDYALFTTKEVK